MALDESTQVGWVTLGEARAQWADAPVDDEYLADLLDSAFDQCEAYAPALAEDEAAPVRYRVAQVMQARAIYRAMKTGDNDSLGADGFTVTVFPMDWNIKNLLRPRRGVPIVG